MFPPVYQVIFDRYKVIQGYAESGRVPIRVFWSKRQSKFLVGVSNRSDIKETSAILYRAAFNLYGGVDAEGAVVGFERNHFIKVRFEKLGDRESFDTEPFEVLLTDADIILVC